MEPLSDRRTLRVSWTRADDHGMGTQPIWDQRAQYLRRTDQFGIIDRKTLFFFAVQTGEKLPDLRSPTIHPAVHFLRFCSLFLFSNLFLFLAFPCASARIATHSYVHHRVMGRIEMFPAIQAYLRP